MMKANRSERRSNTDGAGIKAPREKAKILGLTFRESDSESTENNDDDSEEEI